MFSKEKNAHTYTHTFLNFFSREQQTERDYNELERELIFTDYGKVP